MYSINNDDGQWVYCCGQPYWLPDSYEYEDIDDDESDGESQDFDEEELGKQPLVFVEI